MKTPWLIQRASFRKDPETSKDGIDRILRFDYMGSSEFEWGALPKSLKRIRENIKDYTYLDVPIEGKTVSVFCHSSVKGAMRQYLIDIANKEVRLKEYSDFDNWLIPNEFFKNRTGFWWDIENDIMFWKKSPEFEVGFKKLIGG